MSKLFSLLYEPEKKFKHLMENDDGKHKKRMNAIIFLAAITPFLFILIYEFIAPFNPQNSDAPIMLRIIGLIIPIIFGLTISFVLLKYVFPFLIQSIAQAITKKRINIEQTRFVFAYSLVPVIIVTPLKVIYFADNPIIMYLIYLALIIATLNSLYILFTGVRLVYSTSKINGLIAISPYIALVLIGSFI